MFICTDRHLCQYLHNISFELSSAFADYKKNEIILCKETKKNTLSFLSTIFISLPAIEAKKKKCILHLYCTHDEKHSCCSLLWAKQSLLDFSRSSPSSLPVQTQNMAGPSMLFGEGAHAKTAFTTSRLRLHCRLISGCLSSLWLSPRKHL